jgi:uncharacterized protein (TIGR02996 family)
MTDEDAFLSAIRDRPDDETVRLVYADWLEERNDPRHRLIRLETELRCMPVYAEEYHRRKPERVRLRRGINAGWLSQMGYQPTHRPMFTELPADTADRWRLAAEFIDLWHEPLSAGDGYTEAELADAEARLGRRLPRALREWYAFAGKRRDIWSVQNELVIPERLRFTSSGDLLIWYENQNGSCWYIQAGDLSEDNPPVYEDHNDEQASPTVSDFALFALLYEVKFNPQAIWCNIYLSYEELHRLVSELKPCELSQWDGFSNPVRFWEGKDLIIEDEAGGEWFATIRTEEAYQELLQRTGGRLERLNG